MLDENLPTFYYKPSSDNPRTTTIFLSQGGSELQPEYSLKRPDPSLPASKNCYGVALYDSYNPEVLFAEVLVQPEWQAPTLSQAEIRAQNGVLPPPVPIVPEKFVVQLYNPDQQVTVKQIPGKGMSSAHWEFEMPQTSFRQPSVAAIDRVQNDPTISEATPKITFKWKRDGKLSKDISCFMAGKNTDGRRQKEPDILCAMLKAGNLTLYQPNLGRVDVEDMKGLEVVLLLGSSVIKDIYFNPNREMFNIGPSQPQKQPNRKNSGQAISGKSSGPPAPNQYSPPIMSGAGYAVPPPPPPQQQSSYPSPPLQQQQQYQQQTIPRPNPTPPAQTQAQIDAETARLRAEEIKERARIEARDQKKIKKMLEAEERERLRREAEIEKETERLRKQYGLPSQSPPRVSFSSAPPMPPRPGGNGYQPQNYGRPQGLHAYQSAPHSQPVPVQRPVSTPNGLGSNSAASGSRFDLSSVYNIVQNGISTVSHHAHSHSHGGGSSNGGGGTAGRLGRISGGMAAGGGGSPYLQAPGQGTASSSGFFGLGGKNKVQKKRSVYF